MSSALEYTDLIIPNGGIDETTSPQRIKPNKWTAGLNVEPLFDGCRRRFGSTASNSIALQAIDLSKEAGTANRELITGAQHIAQDFTIGGSTTTVSRIAVRLKKNNATAVAGNINAAIFDDSAGDPGTVVTGLDIGQFTVLAGSSLTTEYAWYFFVVSTGIALTASTLYHLVITHDTPDTTGGATPDIEIDSSGSGGLDTSADKSSWANQATEDMNFRVYSGTSAVTMIADYRLSDASTAFHLVVADGELYKNISGTMTAVSARDRLTLTAGGDILPTWGVMNDRFAFTNDNEISKIFYDLSGTEYYENEGIAAPTATPTFTTPASGSGFSAGEWRLDFYYWNNDIGVSSDRRYNGVDALEVTLVAGDDIVIDANTLYPAAVRENDRFTHIRIELMSVTDGQTVFRFAKEVTITEAESAVTIDENDLPTGVPTGVVAEYEHAVAPVHKLKAVAENRQFIADIAGASYRLMFSAIIGTTPHYHSFPTNNKRDFGKGDGDYPTAIAFIPPRTLIVGQKNSIKAIDARRPGTSDVITISEQVGIAGSHSFKVVGRKLYFISDADQNKGPFVLNSIRDEPQQILGIDDTYKGLLATRMKYASCAHLSPGDTRFQWWTLVTATGATDHNRILIYDYVLGAWSIYDKPTSGANILGQIEEASIAKVYLGDNVGIEHLQDGGDGDSGTAFAANLTLPVYDFGANHIKKRMRRVDYIVSAQTLGGISLVGEMDYGTSPSVSASLTQIVSGGSGAWSTGSTWDTDSTWSSGTDLIGRQRLNGRGRTFQPTLSFTSTSETGNTFHLKGIAFGYQSLRNKVA